MIRVNRRKFVKNSALATAALLAGEDLHAFSKEAENTSSLRTNSSFNLINELLKYRKIDAYANAHLENTSLIKAQIDSADRLGIEKLFISVPVARDMGTSPDSFRAYNDLVLRAVKAYPDRFVGQFTLHPAHLKESLEEIERCVDLGMVGMKLYNQVKISDPLFYPVIENFAKYNMIIHVHGEAQLGVGGYRMKYDVKNTPNISVPEDFVEVAQRYPEVMFQYAHIGGGSDWEYACKAFAGYPNIYVDTGGSNNEENMVDFAVAYLGEDRVFFGCDSSFFQGVGKVLSADLNEKQKRKIFFENYNNVLRKSGRSIN